MPTTEPQPRFREELHRMVALNLVKCVPPAKIYSLARTPIERVVVMDYLLRAFDGPSGAVFTRYYEAWPAVFHEHGQGD